LFYTCVAQTCVAQTCVAHTCVAQTLSKLHLWCNGMVNMLTSSVVDRGFVTWSSQTKDY